MASGFGPDTSVGLLPPPHLLAYYGIFFAVGALYYDAADPARRLGRWWPVLLPVATLVCLPLGLLLGPAHPVVSGVFQAAFAWCMSFGLIGLFSRHLQAERPALRYFSEAAYWMYVAHHPLVVLIHAWIRPLDLPAPVKLALLCAILLTLLLLSYQLLVRHTWIGWLLNGRRDRSRPAVQTPAAASTTS